MASRAMLASLSSERDGAELEDPMSRLQVYALLAAAIVAEVIATSALARSESFTKLLPSIVAIVGYAVAFWLLSFPLRVMPTGVVYAIWSGLGIVLIATVAWLWSGQALDLAALVGLGLIIAGVIVVNVFSNSVLH
jgi:small multidrug resistance pump